MLTITVEVEKPKVVKPKSKGKGKGKKGDAKVEIIPFDIEATASAKLADLMRMNAEASIQLFGGVLPEKSGSVVLVSNTGTLRAPVFAKLLVGLGWEK
jgi:hypothetical protein